MVAERATARSTLRWGAGLGLLVPLALAPPLTVHSQARAVALVEDLHIRGGQEELVGRPDAVWVAPDGRVGVFSETEAQFVLFDRTGARIGHFGRRGPGPGEFTVLAAGPAVSLRAGFAADTLWVYDTRDRRLTFVGPNLLLVRATTLPVISADALQGFTLQAVTPGGAVVVLASLGRPPEPDATGTPVAVWDVAGLLVARDGTVERRLFSGGRDTLRGGRPVSAGTPGGFSRPMVAVSPDGQRMALVRNRSTPSGFRWDVTLLNARGDTLWNRTLENESVAVAQALVGYDGTVLLREQGTSPARVVLLAANGRMVERGTMPRATSLRAVSASHIWGSWFDADGFVDVFRVRVERGG